MSVICSRSSALRAARRSPIVVTRPMLSREAQMSIRISRQRFVKPVIDAEVPIPRSGNFAVLIRALFMGEVDYGLRASQCVV